MPVLKSFVAAATLAMLTWAAPLAARDFTLTILHTNDVHARIDQVTASGSSCSADNVARQRCFGGYARLSTQLAALRASRPNAITLDAGDVFQGTLFYTLAKSDAVKPFLGALGYDAMTLGNHEFDDGPAELARFLEGLTVPVVAANVDARREPLLRGRWQAHRIIEIGGERIGIVGLTTPETTITSSPGETIGFGAPIEALRREVSALQAAGVNKIVALTHLGVTVDADLARQVDGVDIYVGGHSHTLLHNGEDPRRQGPYPLVVRTPSGAPALIVQAFFGGLFLGDLQVTFDGAGVVTRWEGDTIPMDARIGRDPGIQALVDRMAAPLAELRARQVGVATATLDGHPVEIVAGFDRRLGDYFLQIIDERNDMLYTSLQEPLLDWTDIATLRAKVAELGLRLPAQLVDEVEGDGRRRAGNRIVRHLADGPPVTLLAG